jgi:hypothetical protein
MMTNVRRTAARTYIGAAVPLRRSSPRRGSSEATA